MQIIEQNDSRLVLRNTPLLLWINSLIFISIGSALLYYDEITITGWVFISFAIVLAIIPSIDTFSFDTTSSILTIKKRSIWGVRIKELPFSQVAGIQIHHPGGSNRIAILNLNLTNGRHITIADAGRSHSFDAVVQVVQAYLDSSR